MLFFLVFVIVSAKIDFSSTTYPFPSDTLTEINDNTDVPAVNCSYPLISDGKCDLPNNNLECHFDGGDCCRYTCEKNCASGRCPYDCGSRGYHCLESTSCSNCTNGVCKPSSECFSSEPSILLGVLNCLRNTTAHGNSSTADFYCGKDVNRTQLHDFNTFSFHYPGCGLPTEICSKYQCCTDVLSNGATNLNCTKDPRNATVFNPATQTHEYRMISCIDQFRQCFYNNSIESKGECCECKEGWTGRDCDIPTCYPACKNGYCDSIDTCKCVTGWSGKDCGTAICSHCAHGICVMPEVCQCLYGWNGSHCDIPYATPPCLNGVATAPDVCKCNQNYVGDRCDVPLCKACNFGWCISPGVCECYPPYYSKDLTVSWCTDLYCQEIFGENCVSCTNSTCTQCAVGYYLNESLCRTCSDFDINCQQCSLLGCSLCYSPYSVLNFRCSFAGYLEFSSKYYVVLKSNGTAVLTVNRLGPTVDKVAVSYKIVPITANVRSYADFSYIDGSVAFNPGVSAMTINFWIYNSFFDRAFAISFYVILYNPINGIIYNSNLTRILDYTWSDQGLSVISYCIVEILDDPTQPNPAAVGFIQPMPVSIKTTQSYSMRFTAANAQGVLISTAQFIILARQVINTLTQINCVFSTSNFTADSVIYSSFKSKFTNSAYFASFSAVRGMYSLTAFAALRGAYIRTYTNLFFSGTPIEEGIRSIIGTYNPYTMPLGNSSSTWNFVYFPESSISASIVIEINTTDALNLTINESPLLTCIGGCSSSFFPFLTGLGYWFSLNYTHMSTYPGFRLTLQSTSQLYTLNEFYSVNNTGKSAYVYITDTNEC